MMRYVGWGLEILILAIGIHLFLRFVRTTRGNRLIRGLFLSVMVGVVGLWGMSRALGLEELEFLLRSSTGFIVVGFVVIFQSELKRGIAQLGEHSLLGLDQGSNDDVVREVVQAARRLAQRRHGALIVIERETSLHTITETGTEIDADVRASLLESLFHPQTPLHDGAAVIRKDRVHAAGCILPLAEGTLPSRTMGTRHRAGLGLAEETDAVVVVVSEERGSISLACDGAMRPDMDEADLEKELARTLQGRRGAPGEGRSLLAALLGGLRHDLVWLPGSLLIATGIFYIAHQGLQQTKEFQVRFGDSYGRPDKTPRQDEVLVLLANDSDRLADTSMQYWVEVRGTRRQLEELGGTVKGVLRIQADDWEGGPVPMREVEWDRESGLEYSWRGGVTPQLTALRYGRRPFRLAPESLEIDTSEMNPRLQLLVDQLRLEPGVNVEIHGPASELDRLQSGDLPLDLEPLKVSADDRDELRQRVSLDARLRERNLALTEEVVAVVPIVPVAREIGTLTMDIAMVCMDPDRAPELDRWTLPPQSQSARFAVKTLGVIPQNMDPSTPAMIELFERLRRFVAENLKVYADVAELPATGEGRSVRVRWTWRRTWGEGDEGVERGERLNVVLLSDPEVLLEPRLLPKD